MALYKSIYLLINLFTEYSECMDAMVEEIKDADDDYSKFL